MELGKKIRQLRIKAGLTQEQLGEKLGIGAQAVSKWENAVAMPDIATLPPLAEVFGVSIDDLFDVTTEQRLNRIENRMDGEEELPADVFREFEHFLQAELDDEKYRKRATELLAYLYWHRSNAEARKASRYAKEAIRRAPNEKGCQWILSKADPPAGESMTKPKNRRDQSSHACFCNQKGKPLLWKFPNAFTSFSSVPTLALSKSGYGSKAFPSSQPARQAPLCVYL